MTTQTVNCFAVSAKKIPLFTATATDQTWTELLVSNASLGASMKNQSVKAISGDYAAGLATWRIRDTATNSVVRMGFCRLTTEARDIKDEERDFGPPLMIKESFVLEALAGVAPT